MQRDRLEDRIARGGPRLVLLTAPAGFGKSTLAQRLESPGRLEGGALVVEVANPLEPGEARRLATTLAATPAGVTVVVCSRRPLEMPTSKIAPPHAVLTLRARDLAFDGREIAALFQSHALSPDVLDQIEALTCGWPIAVLLLARFADEGRLEAALADADGSAFEELHAYLADEVLEELEPAVTSALLCVAALPDATALDVALATGDDDADAVLGRLLELAPFVERSSDGAYALHPFLRAATQRRYARRLRELARTVACAHESAQRFLRAAQIYRHLGDLDATARAVCADNARPNRRQSPAFTSLVSSLDQDTLSRHRVLRGLTTYPRRFRVDPHRLRDEALAVWETLPPDTEFEVRCNVAGPLTRIMYETGRFEDAERILRALESEAGGIPEIPRSSGEAYVARTLACVLARSGRLSEADGYFRKGYFALPGAEMVESRYAIERALIERLSGRRGEERRFAEQAIELAVERDATVHIACALAEAAFGAWFAGEDERFASYVARLEERVTNDGMRGFAHFCSARRGGAIAEPNGTEQPNWLACAHLVACAASDGTTARGHAECAKASADESNDAFLRVVATVALALLDPVRRNDLLMEALIVAGRIEAPGAQAGVAALLSGDADAGMLQPLVERLSHCVPAASEPLLIEILGRTVRRGTHVIELRERELALLIALARRARPSSRNEIVSLLWPDLDESGARDALNTCLYRLRQRLGDDAVVWSRDEGYRLRDGVRVDLTEIDRWIAALGSKRALQSHERLMLRRSYERLRDARLEAGADWEWLEPVVARVRELRHQAATRLAEEALRRGEHAEALQVAREMETDDPCDEAACEIALRAQHASGDDSGAARRFRYFRDVLRRQLDVEPSEALAALAFGASAEPKDRRMLTVA